MARRITLVNSLDNRRDWYLASNAPTRIVFAASFKILLFAIENALSKYGHDVERVIIDRTASANEYLDLLAHVSVAFAGDLLFVRHDDRAYLSSIARGGDRVLYPLDEHDLRFYLETHGLVAATSVAAA